MFKCKRCGKCCLLGRCSVAVWVYGPGKNRCPALVLDGDGRYTCSLVEGADDDLLYELGIGQECSLPFVERSLELYEEKRNFAAGVVERYLSGEATEDELYEAMGSPGRYSGP